MSDSSIVQQLDYLRHRIIQILVELTGKNKIDWFRQNEESALVYCECLNELLVFELSDGTEENLQPFEDTHGIGLDFRNQKLLWLEGMEDWEDLLGLVKKAQVNKNKLGDTKVIMTEAFVKDLERLL